jgi:hypothetical protein
VIINNKNDNQQSLNKAKGKKPFVFICGISRSEMTKKRWGPDVPEAFLWPLGIK